MRSEELGMRNEELGVESGVWKVKSGVWRVESGAEGTRLPPLQGEGNRRAVEGF